MGCGVSIGGGEIVGCGGTYGAGVVRTRSSRRGVGGRTRGRVVGPLGLRGGIARRCPGGNTVSSGDVSLGHITPPGIPRTRGSSSGETRGGARRMGCGEVLRVGRAGGRFGGGGRRRGRRFGGARRFGTAPNLTPANHAPKPPLAVALGGIASTFGVFGGRPPGRGMLGVDSTGISRSAGVSVVGGMNMPVKSRGPSPRELPPPNAPNAPSIPVMIRMTLTGSATYFFRIFRIFAIHAAELYFPFVARFTALPAAATARFFFPLDRRFFVPVARFATPRTARAAPPARANRF